MKSIFSLITTICIGMSAAAQTGSYGNLQIYNNIRLKDRAITRFNNDSTFANADSVSIPTTWAVYNFINNKSLTGITTNHPYVVNSQTSMLALSAIVGDVAVRTDESKSYILQTLPASTLANWIYMPSPIPSTTDLLSEGATNLYFTNSRALAAMTGKNISIFNNDLNFIQRVELIDSLKRSYTKSQSDSINALVAHKAGNETYTDEKTFAGVIKVPSPAKADSSANAANTQWVKSQNYMASAAPFAQYSVPYANAVGVLIQDPTGLKYDGYNLWVGRGGYYNQTGIFLNGANGEITASGYAGMVIKTNGGVPADPTKGIVFMNGDRTYFRLLIPNLGTPATTPMEMQTEVHIYPTQNDSFSLGKTGRQYKEIWVKDIHVNGVLLSDLLATKTDTSARDTTVLKYPLQYDTSNKIIMVNQAYLDSLQAIIQNAWSENGITRFGFNAYRYGTKTGVTAFGNYALANMFLGGSADQGNQTAFGEYAGTDLKSGGNNSFWGRNSGVGDGVVLAKLTRATNSTFLGNNTYSQKDSIDNSTAVGNGATINKNNQVVIGNENVKETVLRGAVILPKIRPAISTIATTASVSINTDTTNFYTVTALAANVNFAPNTGTPTPGQILRIRIKDNGTARALTFSGAYRFSSDLPAPTTTVLGKVVYMEFIYNEVSSTWDMINMRNNF